MQVNLKDVGAHNAPTCRLPFFNLPHRKVMIYFCQKAKTNGGSPTSFWREHGPKYTRNLKNRASLATSDSVCKPQNIAIRSLK